MSKFFTLLFLLCISLLPAQNSNYASEEFEVSREDLLAKNYALDSTAHAVYIYESGFTEFDPDEDYDVVTDYKAKVKILDKQGIDYATVKVILGKNSDNDKVMEVKDLKAHTFKLVNGRIVKKKIETLATFHSEHKFYDEFSFTFPDVEPGDVIQYSYKLVSPFNFNFKTWQFQEDIPKMHSQFTSKIPGNYEYHTTLTGGMKLLKREEKVIEHCISFGLTSSMAGCLETLYVMKDIPAFIEEDYMTSEDNYIAKIEYELKQVTRTDGFERKYTLTWDDADKEIRTSSNWGKQWKKDNAVKDVLPEAIRSMPNSLEKAKKIYYFVQENYQWSGEYDIHGDMNIKDIIDNQSGNVLELNSLLHNLYASEGFQVSPVLASTRRNGFAPRVHPAISEYNYFFVQLKLDGKEYNLDATDDQLDFGRLPFRALNSFARKINLEGSSDWMTIEPDDFSNYAFKDSIKVHKDGTASGTSNQHLSGYHAVNFRNKIRENGEEKIFQDLSKAQQFTRSTEVAVENLDEVENGLQIEYTLENVSQKINDLIYLNPFSFQFFEKNPFNLDERTYPIDFGYKNAFSYSAEIHIPEGYSVKELPEQKAFRLPQKGGALIFNAVKFSENVVMIQCRMTLSQTLYTPEYYEGLKKFFNELMTVQSQSLIVLEENS
ncbi:DUF3857 domain-containing protein [Christiangramia portivictoriae]|uniref:DUF3857 domain-containing protein n=1 Tax=Christiangramia portivictoriae TaxID=326069 RepID=UPI0003FE5B9F|nr:DUF3857 domain-containing protein [Christiangramia portivictoriae]